MQKFFFFFKQKMKIHFYALQKVTDALHGWTNQYPFGLATGNIPIFYFSFFGGAYNLQLKQKITKPNYPRYHCNGKSHWECLIKIFLHKRSNNDLDVLTQHRPVPAASQNSDRSIYITFWTRIIYNIEFGQINIAISIFT